MAGGCPTSAVRAVPEAATPVLATSAPGRHPFVEVAVECSPVPCALSAQGTCPARAGRMSVLASKRVSKALSDTPWMSRDGLGGDLTASPAEHDQYRRLLLVRFASAGVIFEGPRVISERRQSGSRPAALAGTFDERSAAVRARWPPEAEKQIVLRPTAALIPNRWPCRAFVNYCSESTILLSAPQLSPRRGVRGQTPN